MDFMAGDPFFAGEEADYLLISREVLPALREAGVAQADIDAMMVVNPSRFLVGDGDRATAVAAREQASTDRGG
jgi:hypothetical protein